MGDLQGDAVRDAVQAALRAGDRDQLRLLLHPYLHWTRPDGTRIRGRNQVLDLLAPLDGLDPPAACELRDHQIYRWTEPPASTVG